MQGVQQLSYKLRTGSGVISNRITKQKERERESKRTVQRCESERQVERANGSSSRRFMVRMMVVVVVLVLALPLLLVMNGRHFAGPVELILVVILRCMFL